MFLSSNYYLLQKKFFNVVKNTKRKIYPLNNFLSIQHGIVNYVPTVAQISRTFSPYMIETLCLLNSYFWFSPLSIPWQAPFKFLLLIFPTVNTLYEWNQVVFVPL